MAFLAVLKTATENKDDLINLWYEVLEAKTVENLIGVNPKMSSDIEEIMKAHNAGPTYNVRIQIVTPL